MRPVARRLLWALVATVLLVVGLIAIAAMLLYSEPDFYRPLAMSAEQVEAAAKRVEDKLVEIRNVAAETRLDPPGADSQVTYVVTFTQDELNAFVRKWTELRAVRGQLDGRIADPMLAMEPGRVILAGRADIGPVRSVIAVDLSPRLEGERLHLQVGRVRAGRLPVPAVAWEGELTRATGALESRLSEWRAGARLDSRGTGNDQATRATYARLLLAALEGGSVDATLLVPVDGDRGVPVRLTKVDVRQGEITFEAVGLEMEARNRFIEQLRSE